MADVGFFSAVSAVFGAGFAASRPVVEVDGSAVQVMSFPGGYNVACLEGRHLLDDEVADDAAWHDLRLDLFVSAEEALVAMQTVDPAAVKTFLSVDNLVTHAQDKYRKVRIKPQTNVHTFVPSSVLMGLTLLHQHKFDIARKIRLSTLVARSLERSLELYPRIAREPAKAGGDASSSAAGATDASRFSELGVTTEEFELTQKANYAACYRTMRALIPPNIAKTDLKTMIADGVPRKVARHIWERKALWLICMHPSDVPRIHIADLRGKYVAAGCGPAPPSFPVPRFTSLSAATDNRYNFHGLDLVEMRALHHVLPTWEGNASDNQKADWRRTFKVRGSLSNLPLPLYMDSTYAPLPTHPALTLYPPRASPAR